MRQDPSRMAGRLGIGRVADAAANAVDMLPIVGGGAAFGDVLAQPRKSRSQLVRMVAPHPLEVARGAALGGLENALGLGREGRQRRVLDVLELEIEQAGVWEQLEDRGPGRVSGRHPRPAAREVVEDPERRGVLAREAH